MQTGETDAELLSRYLQSRNEAAFTELVNRHVALVYSAACRETNGDTSAAEDVTQLVFIELARKAARLTQSTGLAGWLYMSVRHVSANRRREQLRRALREQKAHMMNEPHLASGPDFTWKDLAPVLDDALHDLNEQDRNAIVLRFLEENTLQKVGAALGLTENAARMRVERALDKLRGLLAKRGVTSTASSLAVALAAIATVSTPPASLAGTVASSALASSATGTSSLLATIFTTQVKVGILTTLIVGGIAAPWVVRQLSPGGNGSAGPIPTDAILTGAFLFSSDPAGNPAGNFAWDTRGTDSDFYKVWLSQGSPKGIPDGLTSAFVNGPEWAAAPIHLRLNEGTNRFTMFFQHDGMWPTMGLNLFFNSNLVPAITVKATGRVNDEETPFSENRARRTYSLTSYPLPNVRAGGAKVATVLNHQVELTEYYHVVSTNFFGLDRVSSHAAEGDGRFDCVATFTLVVGPREERSEVHASQSNNERKE